MKVQFASAALGLLVFLAGSLAPAPASAQGAGAPPLRENFPPTLAPTNWVSAQELATLPRRMDRAEEVVIKEEGEYLDDKCSGTLALIKKMRAESGWEGKANFESARETRKTGRRATYLDLSEPQVFSQVKGASAQGNVISILIEEQRAYPEYAGDLVDLIERQKYPTFHPVVSLFINGLTAGLLLFDKSNREATFGCETRRLVAKVVDPQAATPTGRFGMEQIVGTHSVSIHGLGPVFPLTGIVNGRGEIQLDDDRLMFAPTSGTARIRVQCDSCKRSEVFGGAEGFNPMIEVDLDFASVRLAAFKRKVNTFFRATLTDSAIDRLLQGGLDTDRKVAAKFDQMRRANYGYDLDTDGFFEYLSDEKGAGSAGKTVQDFRNARVQALREKQAAEQARARREQQERDRKIAEEFPFEAFIGCGFVNDHLNILLCMTNDFTNTTFEIRNGDAYGRYTPYNIQRLGQDQFKVGLKVRLRANFSLVLQNASREYLLTLAIYDMVTKRLLYQSSASRYETLRVSNDQLRLERTMPAPQSLPPRSGDANAGPSLLNQVLGKKWGLPPLPCDLNGGSYEIYSRERGLIFTAGGREQLTTAPNQFQFTDRGMDSFVYKHTFYANDLVARSLRDPNAITMVLETEVTRLSDTRLRLRKKITQLDFDRMLAGVKRYTTQDEVVERYLCSSR